MPDHFKETFKLKRSKELILPALERHVMKEAALPDGRRSDVLHPSEMAKGGWCHRHDYYRIVGLAPDFKGKANAFTRENIFANGHLVHGKYQQWLGDMGILWGRWECTECHLLWVDTSPRRCPDCKGPVVYREIPLGQGIIGGHADGGLILDSGNALLEVKTIGLGSLPFDAPRLHEEAEEKQLTLDEIWFRIKRPFASHQRQGQMYLHLASKIPNIPVFDRIVYLYEWKPTQAVKEFVVKRNPAIIDTILDRVHEVEQAIKHGEPPARPETHQQDGKVCRECEYRATCWGKPKQEDPPPIRVHKVSSAKRRKALRPGA